MTQELATQFNDEVERYRRSLLYFAAKADWGEFKARAARLFEYLENIEASERERRFYRVFFLILLVLCVGVIIVLGIDSQVSAEWFGYRRSLLMTALGGCSFELFFYLNFRWYVEARMAGFLRRRAAFIRGMEHDFRSYAMGSERPVPEPAPSALPCRSVIENP